MTFTKLGEAFEIQLESMESCIPQVSDEILAAFTKTATALKKIAPKAEDFLYFSAVMMHAAESAAINDDGTPKLTASGQPVKVSWDDSNGSMKWVSNDPNLRPMKNNNGDIFPEVELIKAHSKWRTKPLCVDHKSSSVDHTRGFIVDTYYDRKLKRVIALCALDKISWPALARQVSTGVSNCVSMGTGVKRAVCYDCGRVARAESDFCSHMKHKTGYGEINLDLDPLELSIVVNGADPKAHIKHIIAAANTMNTYLDNRSKQLDKLAANYTATLNLASPNSNEAGNGMQINVAGTDLDSFKQDIERGLKELEGFSQIKDAETATNEATTATNSVSKEDEVSQTDSGLTPQSPQALRFANDSLTELQNVSQAIEEKLNQMKQSLAKLFSTQQLKQEETMSDLNKNAYFQGAGGVNEPTPGQVKYPKDPLNEQCRIHEDKQMNGQSPFPEVGAVDGMHPSPASADPKDELERKKMLARAELEDRAMKRNAIVETAKKALENRAYFLGGGGVNEPTPGKPKYPKDKLNEELREYEDKQMVGQSPFPQVGPVDGLHPSPSSADPKDELKRKQMLAREPSTAQLKARFVKASNQDGSQNKSKSGWEVFLGDKLLLTASVDELTGGNTELLYGQVATKEFGGELIQKVKTLGANGFSALLVKKGQATPADVSAPPPAGDMGAPAPEGTPVEDAGKDGDPKSVALDLAKKSVALSSDLLEAVRALTGEKAEMGAEEAGAPVGMADDSMTSSAGLNSARVHINASLTQAMKESIAELNNSKEEMDMIADLCDRGAVSNDQDFASSVIQDAMVSAKATLADGFQLMTAFVKYAHSTEALIKHAEVEAELQKLAEGDSMSSDVNSKKDSQSADGDLMGLINDTNADLDAVKNMMGDESLDGNALGGEGDLSLEGDLGLGEHEGHEGADDLTDPLAEGTHDLGDADVQVKTPEDAAKVSKMDPNAHVMVQADFNTLAGRQAMRAKLAADATGKQENGEIQDVSKLKYSDMLDQADGLADGQTHLDVKPSTSPFPLGLVETKEEQMKRMLEVAKMPPKVRKEAEAIQKMVVSGKLDPKDVDALVAEGLDKDAVSYWKKYYGEVDGGSEFASELVKEHVKAHVAAEFDTYRIKIARAYELAYDMAERGLCGSERSQVSAQVDEIMKFNDESFESLKKVVARHSPTTLRKQASRLPQVGLIDSEEMTHVIQASDQEDSFAALSSAFGNRKGNF